MKIHAVFCAHDRPGNFAGGPNAWLQRILPDLKNIGISVTTLVIGRGPAEKCPLVSGLRASGLPVYFLDQGGSKPLYLQQKIRWLVERLNILQPDVFVPNLVIAAYYAARWVRQAGIPTIGVIHSNDDFYHQLLNVFVYGADRWRIDAVVAVSRHLETVIAAGNTKYVLLERIPYGVPIPDLVPRTRKQRLCVAYVGRFTQEQKRILDVTKSFCAASMLLPNTTFTLIGNGPERERMQAIIEKRGVATTVRIHPPLPPAEIQEFMQSQDICVLLSDYEGLPIALQEAMATGAVPVCLREVSGTSELIHDGRNGFLVDDRNLGFISRLRKLDSDRDLLARLSDGARQSICGDYSSHDQHKKWCVLIERLATSRNRKAISLPLRLNLPGPYRNFKGEDAVAPKVREKIRAGLKQWPYELRLALRPRTRARVLWKTLKGKR